MERSTKIRTSLIAATFVALAASPIATAVAGEAGLGLTHSLDWAMDRGNATADATGGHDVGATAGTEGMDTSGGLALDGDATAGIRSADADVGSRGSAHTTGETHSATVDGSHEARGSQTHGDASAGLAARGSYSLGLSDG